MADWVTPNSDLTEHFFQTALYGRSLVPLADPHRTESMVAGRGD